MCPFFRNPSSYRVHFIGYILLPHFPFYCHFPLHSSCLCNLFLSCIAAFCGLSFLLAIKITSKLSNFILHQFGGLHKLWDALLSNKSIYLLNHQYPLKKSFSTILIIPPITVINRTLCYFYSLLNVIHMNIS